MAELGTERIGIAAVGGALATHPADDNVQLWAEEQGPSDYTRIGRTAGDGWIQGGAALATYGVGLISGHRTVAHVGSDLIRAQVLNAGDYETRRMSNIIICARTMRNTVELLKPGVLVVTPGDRDDIILAVSLAAIGISGYLAHAGAQATARLLQREESLRLVRLRFDAGASSELDVRQAQSLTEGARVALAQQQRQRALDLNALALLVGQPVPPALQTGTAFGQVTLPDLPAQTPAEVLLARPDVRQAEQQLVAANANIGAARAAFFPRISLTAGLGTASNELSALFNGGSWGWTAAPQLLAPIFDAGRNRAGLRSANVSRDIAVAQYEKAIQSAFREVSDALAGRATLGEQLQAQANVAEAEAVRFRLSQLRYDNGVSSYLDLLDADVAALEPDAGRMERLGIK